MLLNDCAVKDLVIIKKIKGDYLLKRRFLDLGIIPDNKIECVLISPFKDPKAYKVNDTVISLRNKDAKNIEVIYERN